MDDTCRDISVTCIAPTKTFKDVYKRQRIICDIYCADKTPFTGDSRYILKRQIEEAKNLGYTFNVGPECEFFLFHQDENGQPTTLSHEKAGYFDLGPVDLGENEMCIRGRLCSLLDQQLGKDADREVET